VERVQYRHGAGLELVLTENVARRYPAHVHTRHAVVGVLAKGRLTLATPAGTRALSAGMCFVVPSGVPHALSLDAGSALAVLCIEQPPRWPENAMTRIARQFAETPWEPHALRDTAQRAGCSQWQFLRAFRKATGLTPHVWLTACRLRQVRRLLRCGTTMAEAALAAGFFDQSHMQRVFKRHHGLTPAAFRAASVNVDG